MLQARYLESLPDHVHKYAGSLNVFGPVEMGDFLAFFKSFRKGIRKRFGTCVKFRPVTEVGPDARRLHLHFAMTADGVEVTKADIESAWQEACGSRRVRVVHGPMRDVAAWSRYMFKADSRNRQYHDPANPAECVVLFAKCSPKLPQATPGFFPGEVKAALWREWKAEQEERKAQRHLASEPVGDAVPPRSRGEPLVHPTPQPSVHRRPFRKDSGKTRDIRRFETRSGNVVPQDERQEKSRKRGGKTAGKRRLKHRVTGQFGGCWAPSRVPQSISTGRHPRGYRRNGRSGQKWKPVSAFGARHVSHRDHGEARSIHRVPERPVARLLGPLTRLP